MAGLEEREALHPSVPLVEELLASAAGRTVAAVPRWGDRLHVTHAVYLCACETLADSVRWLIYAIGEDGIGWQRLADRQYAEDVVDADHLTGDHPDPDAVLEWLRGESPYPNGWRSPSDFIYDELLRRLRPARR